METESSTSTSLQFGCELAFLSSTLRAVSQLTSCVTFSFYWSNSGVHLTFATEKLVDQLEKEYGVEVDLEKDMSLEDFKPPMKEQKEWVKIFSSPLGICGLIPKK